MVILCYFLYSSLLLNNLPLTQTELHRYKPGVGVPAGKLLTTPTAHIIPAITNSGTIQLSFPSSASGICPPPLPRSSPPSLLAGENGSSGSTSTLIKSSSAGGGGEVALSDRNDAAVDRTCPLPPSPKALGPSATRLGVVRARYGTASLSFSASIFTAASYKPQTHTTKRLVRQKDIPRRP